MSHHRAYAIASQAREMEVDINFPLTFDEFLKGQFVSKSCSPLHIDDLDVLLRQLARGAKLGQLTITADTFEPHRIILKETL